MAGVTTTGFVTKTLDEIDTELDQALRTEFGDSIDTSPQSNFGQLKGVIAEFLSDIWAMGADVYSAFTADGATGASLVNLAGLTGTTQRAATFSTVTLTATGTPGTILTTGRQASVTGTGVRFLTLADATIVAVTAWAPTTAYVVGDRRRNGGTQRIYECVTAGTSAGSGGPTTTDPVITDGTCEWRYLGDGTGAIDAESRAETTGPNNAVSGSIITIETPVSGWAGVINTLDADLGSDVESDAALRLRRETELSGAGRASINAIRSAISGIVGVVSVTVFENTSDVTDVDGLPPHSVEVLVNGGDTDTIRETVFEYVAAGIETYGNDSAVLTDTQGIDHTIAFSRPVEKNIYVTLNLTVDATLWPSDGATQVKNAVVAFGDLQKCGKDVVAAAQVAQAFKVAGVLDGTALIGLSPSPGSSATISIALRELAKFDTSRIVVTATPGTP